MLQSGKVERVRFSKDGTMLQLTAIDGRRATVVLPNDPELVDILAKNGVDISVSEGDQQGNYVALLGNILFPLIAFGGLFFLFRWVGLSRYVPGRLAAASSILTGRCWWVVMAAALLVRLSWLDLAGWAKIAYVMRADTKDLKTLHVLCGLLGCARHTGVHKVVLVVVAQWARWAAPWSLAAARASSRRSLRLE
jgi:hypothetical protein